MPSADLFQGVKSKAGGLTGQNHNVILSSVQFVEHALEKKGPDKVTVIERYPTGCYAQLDIFVEDADVDPEHRQGSQFLQVGRPPLWRTQQLGEQPDKIQVQFPGGFMPSLDNEKPATAGPFVYVEGEDGIWEGAEWIIFATELANLASAAGQLDRLKAETATKGVAALNGLRCHLGTKAKPKGKNAKKDDKERSVLVPDKVNQWPWEQAGQQPVAAIAQPVQPVQPQIATPRPVAPVAAAAPVAVAQAPIAAPAATVAAPAAGGNGGGNGTDFDTLAVTRIRKVVKAAGGQMPLDSLLSAMFADTADLGNGADRTQVMQRLYDGAWIARQAAAGAFLSDGKTLMYAGG